MRIGVIINNYILIAQDLSGTEETATPNQKVNNADSSMCWTRRVYIAKVIYTITIV